ncbi:hypothetical protein GCM10009789_38930 [Kribbella sancticallisti]|uniref:Uncharacterized protein n=1 Tax=Kribbella sancticallisti TaxID=460087 RepID=A0ABP4PK51_9ACTN
MTQVDGIYRPTSTFLTGLAGELDVPAGYPQADPHRPPRPVRRQLNGWLTGSKAKTRLRDDRHELIREAAPGMANSFLLRTFQDRDGPGLGRAFLSEHYKLMDNLDALIAMLAGIHKAGVEIDIRGCDLTARGCTCGSGPGKQSLRTGPAEGLPIPVHRRKRRRIRPCSPGS